jgi:hypothetical protein
VSDEQVALLREIRDNQREALAMQRDAIAMQREAVQTQRDHVAMYKAQFQRWMKLTRVAMFVLVPLIVVLLLTVAVHWIQYLLWWLTK